MNVNDSRLRNAGIVTLKAKIASKWQNNILTGQITRINIPRRF